MVMCCAVASGDRQAHRALSDNPVGAWLACHISDKTANQMGGPPLPVSLNSLRLGVEGNAVRT